MIRITRTSNSDYSFAESDKVGLSQVAKALTFTNISDYAISSKIHKFDKRTLTFKIGMLSSVEEYAEENNLNIEIEDYEYQLPKSIEIDDRMSGKYNHQRKAVEAFFKRRFGIIAVPTRGGKTFIASEILRIFLQTDIGQALFIVDSVDLFKQAVGDIKEFFERYGGIEIGEIKAGKIETDKRVTVAMIQTLQSSLSKKNEDKKKKVELNKYLKNLKFLCVDEIHDNCSDSRLSIYKKSKRLEYQLCLSATPYRQGAFVQNLKLQSWSGDIIYNIEEQTLREEEVLSDYLVFMLLLDHNSIDYDIESEDYMGYRKKLIFENELRNSFLLKTLEILRELNLKTLVLFQSVEHGRAIEKISGIPFISGETKSAEREEAKNNFLKGSGGFLLASDIFKKGITLPSVEVMLLANGGLEAAQVIQKKGRVLGTTETKKKSLVIDFLDVYDLYFSKHSEARLNVYTDAIGDDKVGILDTTSRNCFKVLKKWIIDWFENEKDFSDLP